MSETTDLVVIEKANAMTVFKSTDQIEDILQKVEREVMSFVPDVTTAKGRKEIASLAYKVAQTKTYLDGLGKDCSGQLKL
ncbi:cell envelope biogenesis protein TolA, partial [Cronobacter sakazakii]|nr:cell envelope biogenesis protein TolA [Cronobacter sakazakii]